MSGDLDRARTVAARVGERYSGVREVYLTGSRARGDARADSDYDFVIVLEGGQDLSPFEVVGVARDDLERDLLATVSEALGGGEADCYLLRTIEFDDDEIRAFTSTCVPLWQRPAHRALAPR